MTDYSCILRKMAAEGQGYFSEEDRLRLLKAADRIAELEVLLKDCADELEAHLDEDYKRRTGIILPEYRLKYERDMAPVIAARAALSSGATPLNGEK